MKLYPTQFVRLPPFAFLPLAVSAIILSPYEKVAPENCGWEIKSLQQAATLIKSRPPFFRESPLTTKYLSKEEYLILKLGTMPITKGVSFKFIGP